MKHLTENHLLRIGNSYCCRLRLALTGQLSTAHGQDKKEAKPALGWVEVGPRSV